MIQYCFLPDSDAPVPDAYIDQITALYRQAGWWEKPEDDPEQVCRIIAGSHFFLAAMETGRIVGFGRVISDRASDAYIQDVTVASAWRHKGIGTRLVQRLAAEAEKAGLLWVGLIAEKNTHRFYEQIGFQIMPDATPMKR